MEVTPEGVAPLTDEILNALEDAAAAHPTGDISREDILSIAMAVLKPSVGDRTVSHWMADGETKRRLCTAVERGLESNGCDVERGDGPSLETDVALTFRRWGQAILVHTSGLTDFGMPEVGIPTTREGVDEALLRLNVAYNGVISNPDLAWVAWATDRTAETDDGGILAPVASLGFPVLVEVEGAGATGGATSDPTGSADRGAHGDSSDAAV